jgi:hypothetical protein
MWWLKHMLRINIVAGLTPVLAAWGYQWLVQPPQHQMQLVWYMVAGLVILIYTLTSTLWIGCWIVRIMKGPAYVDDAYSLPKEMSEEGRLPGNGFS